MKRQTTLNLGVPVPKNRQCYLTLTVEQAKDIVKNVENTDGNKFWTEAMLLKIAAERHNWYDTDGNPKWVVAQFIRKGMIGNYTPPTGVVYIVVAEGNSAAPSYHYGQSLDNAEPLLADVIRNRILHNYTTPKPI